MYALVRSGDLVGIQIGCRASGGLSGAELEEYICRAYERTAPSLGELPANPPAEVH